MSPSSDRDGGHDGASSALERELRDALRSVDVVVGQFDAAIGLPFGKIVGGRAWAPAALAGNIDKNCCQGSAQSGQAPGGGVARGLAGRADAGGVPEGTAVVLAFAGGVGTNQFSGLESSSNAGLNGMVHRSAGEK
jgi:hypothetical protein